MKATMNALDLLTEQHDEVDQLISQIENSDDPEEKAELFAQVADRLAAHAKIEELLFYPACVAAGIEDEILEAVEEHLTVKRVLADMLDLDPEDRHWDAKLKVVKDLVEHHAREEEEGKLFPKVRKAMSGDELEGLAGELAAMFEMLLDQEPRFAVPAETQEPASVGL